MGTEQETEGSQVEGVTMLVEKLGLVLARIESSPWNKGPNHSKDQQSNQSDKGFRQTDGNAKGGQAGGRPKTMAKTSGENYREDGKGMDQEGKKGATFKKMPYNPDRFCVAHLCSASELWTFHRRMFLAQSQTERNPSCYHKGKREGG